MSNEKKKTASNPAKEEDSALPRGGGDVTLSRKKFDFL